MNLSLFFGNPFCTVDCTHIFHHTETKQNKTLKALMKHFWYTTWNWPHQNLFHIGITRKILSRAITHARPFVLTPAIEIWIFELSSVMICASLHCAISRGLPMFILGLLLWEWSLLSSFIMDTQVSRYRQLTCGFFILFRSSYFGR